MITSVRMEDVNLTNVVTNNLSPGYLVIVVIQPNNWSWAAGKTLQDSIGCGIFSIKWINTETKEGSALNKWRFCFVWEGTIPLKQIHQKCQSLSDKD